MPESRAMEPVGPKLTPMMAQYLRLKSEHPDALLLFRLGDFYELFFEDAETAAPILDVVLTTRSRKDEVPIPMCGIPHFAAQSYIAKLLAAGHKVAICEQMEDPATARGLVERQVVRVVTPGTVLEEECLDPRLPNYLAAVQRSALSGGAELALVELSTGESYLIATGEADLWNELELWAPRELLLPAGEESWAEVVAARLPHTSLTFANPEWFSPEPARSWLAERQAELPEACPALAPLAALLAYLERTHRASLAHLRVPERFDRAAQLALDAATQRNLELFSTFRGEERGSLLWVLDRTRTPMGSRLLRRWLLAPLADPVAIGARLDAVEELLERGSVRRELQQLLAAVGDLERLLSRLSARRVQPRELAKLRVALRHNAAIKRELAGAQAELLAARARAIEPLPDLCDELERALVDEVPSQLGQGPLIRAGFDPLVDELRELAASGKQFIADLEMRERQRTGIGSLKVRFNNVFGYYIEVTKPNLHLVPPDYRRKQTTANAERFVTPELEDYERRVVGAEERLRAREAELFATLIERAAARHRELSQSAQALAELDVFAALAEVAEHYHYVRPRLDRSRRLWIREGRHPVVEAMAGRRGFVPNDCELDPQSVQMITLTGPNMAGKSTYLRQVALIVLLAQIGSFVPASEAQIGVVDRLFTRVGASDNLAQGESTFMVEMKETAHILAHLTPRSLVVLDEIGRGTSTFDGISIAWAVAEYLHESKLRPLVLFATHYHELTDLARVLPRIANYSVAVREWKGEVVFLRRIVPGPASKSYGIEVARLAGVPEPVIRRAREILHNLEQGELDAAGQPRLARSEPETTAQMALFEEPSARLAADLASLAVEELKPVEALVKLDEFVRRARTIAERR